MLRLIRCKYMDITVKNKRVVSMSASLKLLNDRWATLPTEARLRAAAIRQARGILRIEKKLDPVVWQRKLRGGDERRTKKLDVLWERAQKRTRNRQK